MSEPGMVVTEEQAKAKWEEMAPLIEALHRRTDNRDDFRVSPRSSLAGDDRASNPYQTSHSIRMCLLAAADHLHAAKTLVVDLNTLHVAATASLTRGALENAATAVWVLYPQRRDERVLRTLRWQSRNFRDQDAATSSRGLPGYRPLEDKLEKIAAVARARGVSESEAKQGYKMSTAVEDAESLTGVAVMFPWQLCSGFAHGRPWAYFGASDREELETHDPLVVDVRLTSNYVVTLYPALMAMRLLQDLLGTFEQRAGSN